MAEKLILLVEDNIDDVMLALRALKKSELHARITVLQDGIEALNYLFNTGPYAGSDLNEMPDLVLLDLKLGQMSGLDILRQMRAAPHTRSIPVVIMTSSREQRDIDQSYGLGANSYLRKPVDFEQFVPIMRQVVHYWLFLNEAIPPQGQDATPPTPPLPEVEAVSESPPAPIPSTQSQEGASGLPTPLRVLIIEDSEDDVRLLVRTLEKAGYDLTYERVDTADAMNSALDRESWSIIISDHRMPRFSAPAALNLLQARNIDLPFIIVSGSIGEDIAVSAMKAGAHDYVLKGNLTRLAPAVERELREAEMRREHRLAESALHESEAHLRTVVASAGDGIIIADEHGSIEIFNPAAEKIFGYTAAEAIGQNLNILVNHEQYQDHSEYMQEYYRTGISRAVNHTRELIGQRKDGTLFPMELSVSEASFDRGRFFTGIARDITDRKRATSERLRAERMRVEIEKERELIEIRERFMSMVSHDLRTPLTIILSSVELILRYQERLSLDKHFTRIEGIKEQAQSMLAMLNDILLVSQAEAGKLELHPTFVNVEDFCRRLFEKIQIEGKYPHEFVFNSQGALDNVLTDEKLLHRILTNLLTNAIKYSPDGGTIRLSLTGLADEVVYVVSDEGIGIPAEDHANLFEAFHRGANTGTIDGTGLGLAIVKMSVDSHQGTMDFESEEGKGTTFIVRLPRQYIAPTT